MEHAVGHHEKIKSTILGTKREKLEDNGIENIFNKIINK